MKYLIWDFDGTLAYRDGKWSGAIVDILDEHLPGHGLCREDARQYLQSGMPWHQPDKSHQHIEGADHWWECLYPMFVRVFESLGIERSVAFELARHVRQAFIRPESWSLYDDSLLALEALAAAGWSHVILSNHVPELPSLIRHLGLGEYVVAIFNSAQIGYEKPHPEAFRDVLSSLGPIEEVWMIGDNPNADIAGAAALGIPGILVRNPPSDATHCCESLLQIAPLLTAASG